MYFQHSCCVFNDMLSVFSHEHGILVLKLDLPYSIVDGIHSADQLHDTTVIMYGAAYRVDVTKL